MNTPKRPNPDMFDDNEATILSPEMSPSIQKGLQSNQIVNLTEETRLLGQPNKDFHGNLTVIGEEMTAFAPVAELKVIQGIKEGSKFPLLDPEVSFGREKDNTISFPDLAVSRYHFKIKQEKKNYFLEDVGKGRGNGTSINGKKIRGKVKLTHGDRIQVGKSLLQFLLVGEAIPSGNSGPSKGLLVGLFLIILCLSGVVLYIILAPQGQSEQIVEQEDPKKKKAKPFIKEGKQSYKQKQWGIAITYFRRALEFDPNNITVQDYIQKAKIEKRTAFDLKRAEQRINNKEWANAKKLLEKIEENMIEGSVYMERVWETLNKVKKESQQTISIASVKAQKSSIEEENRSALEAYKKALAEAKQTNKRRRRRGRRRKMRLPPPPVMKKFIKAAVVIRGRKTETGTKLFNSGRLLDATKAFKKEGNSSKLIAIRKFSTLWRQSRIAHQSRNSAEAITKLTKALRLDMRVGGGMGRYTRQIRKMLADMYASKGQYAFSQKKFSAAARSFRNALSYHRKHRLSKAFLARLTSRAQNWLKQAQNLSKSGKRDEAKAYLRKVLQVTSRNSTLYKKARSMLGG